MQLVQICKRGSSFYTAAVLGFLVSGCEPETWQARTKHDGGESARAAPGGANGLLVDPASGALFVEAHHRDGRSTSLRLLATKWGRLVDVYDLDEATGARTLRLRDVLIGEELGAAADECELSSSLVNGAEQLTIRHAFGSERFAAALAFVQAQCGVIEDRSFAPDELPPFSRVPRNAVIALDFDDLLDAQSIHRASVALVGGDELDRALPARVWAAPSRGGLVDGVFHSTRVLVDPRADAARAGLPAASTTARANIGLRLKSEARGADAAVRNLVGATLSKRSSGSSDGSDVVRAFRSGGQSGATGDPFAGFMADTTPPRLVLDVGCTLTRVTQPAGGPPDEFDVLVRFNEPGCALRRRPGDVITTAGHVAEVLSATPTFARVKVLQGSPATFSRGSATYTAPWTTWLGQNLACALEFSPAAGGPLATEVSANASIRVRFNEPMEPQSLRPFDSFRIERNGAPALETWVVGQVFADADLRGFTFQPQLPLSHVQGQEERYRVDLDGARITDLAGNALADDPPPIEFKLAAGQATLETGGVALRFDAVDEDGDGRGELRGQVLFDFGADVLRPRAVTRFSVNVDPTQPLVGAMVQLPAGVRGPLSPYGSRTMSLWRYADMGMGLRDEMLHNLDVEGLWWQPSGAVSADSYPQFQMSLAHSLRLPDEALDTGLLPQYPLSGLGLAFASNHDSSAIDPLTVVHDKSAGYTVNPADVLTSTSGLPIAPWPLNRGVAPSQYTYWTWRDTAKQLVGGPNNTGAPLQREVQVLGGNAVTKGFYATGKVPTIGLPLLTEIRTYPSPQASGLNSLAISIAINSSARPYFRAQSTGGVNPSTGAVTIVDPDNSPTATGSFNSNGLPSAPGDNAVHQGQADFVVRISRFHTRWLAVQGAAPQFEPALLEFETSLPSGVQVIAAYRGASTISATSAEGWRNPNAYDSYGDALTAAQLAQSSLPANLLFTPQFHPSSSDATWKSSTTDLDGARYVQARVSFVSDAVSGAAGALDTLAIAYRR